MPKYPRRIRESHLDRAALELEIDVPIYACRVVGNRLEIYCYGGIIYHWPPQPGELEESDDEQ